MKKIRREEERKEYRERRKDKEEEETETEDGGRGDLGDNNILISASLTVIIFDFLTAIITILVLDPDRHFSRCSILIQLALYGLHVLGDAFCFPRVSPISCVVLLVIGLCGSTLYVVCDF